MMTSIPKKSWLKLVSWSQWYEMNLWRQNLKNTIQLRSKTKYSSTTQCNTKKPKKWGFKNLTRAGITGFMYDFFVYDGNKSAELDDGKFGHLKKCAQVVAKLCDDITGHKNYKVFFDSWFVMLDPLHHFRSKGIHADWTDCEVVLLMQTKISWKMAKVLWITVVIAVLEKWV